MVPDYFSIITDDHDPDSGDYSLDRTRRARADPAAEAVRTLFPRVTDAQRRLSTMTYRSADNPHLLARAPHSCVRIDCLDGEGLRADCEGDCVQFHWRQLLGPLPPDLNAHSRSQRYWIDPGDGSAYWDTPQDAPSFILREGYEFATPDLSVNAPGKAALGRRTCVDILHHLTTQETLPPHELSIYQAALRQDLDAPSRDPAQWPRHGWLFGPHSNDFTWNLEPANRDVETYLATALHRRHEATLDLVSLYVQANYLWRVLTSACDIADHPDQDLSYWLETDRPGARSRQQLVEDVENEVFANHPLLESLLHAFPAREGDGPLSFRTWLRGFGPDETIRWRAAAGKSARARRR